MNHPQEPLSGGSAGDENAARANRRWPNPPSRTPELELSDELVLCCLDQISWRPVVRPRIIGLGLASCVIGQLMAARQIQLVDRSLVMSYSAQPPTTVLSLEVWEAIKAEHSAQPVKTWLVYLAEQGLGSGGIFARVSDRMASRGQIAIERQGLLSRRIAYVPPNPAVAAWPLARLRQALNRENQDAPTGRDAFLAGVLARMGLEQRLADTDLGRSRLKAAAAGLEAPFRKLLSHLDAAVGEAAMTQRP